MIKDFLFLNYSWVYGSTNYFEYFRKKGHTIDIIDEKTIDDFTPNCKYKNVVIYYHDLAHIDKINSWLNNELRDSFVFQHDDTDHEQIRKWVHKGADVYLMRELTDNTQMIDDKPVIPFHFPMESIFDEDLSNNKEYDVCFIGRITNGRRIPFINHINNLKNNSLNHLRWYIDTSEPRDYDYSNLHKPTRKYSEVINQSKISLHYPGNSYDSVRIWEIASTNSCLLMPELKIHSATKKFIPFTNYEKFDENLHDLEHKILSLIENDNWKNSSYLTQLEYNENHTKERCQERYYELITKYSKK